MDFDLELRAVPKVAAVVILSVTYARFISSHLRPGLPRLLPLLPVLSLLPFLPMLFTSIHFRTNAGFFISWLCLFKLLLLCFGRGPLDPSLPFISFLSLASLPVKLPTTNDPKNQSSFHSLSPKYLLTTAIKAALFAGLLSLYRFRDQMHPYLFLVMLCFHIYLSLELLLGTAAILAGAILGMEFEPQFNKPYFSSSLCDFWGRRWNLMVSAILRPSVYIPVRSCTGRAAAVIATFIVSGIMHELMFYYITLLPPNGVVLLFFILHGICTAVEGWYAQHGNWRRPPKILATVGAVAFVTYTSFWLFFPAMLRGGALENGMMEIESIIGLFTGDMYLVKD
ncbi:MBOAT (membrane bound O-acyl transferase) family protein [Rhynchospora pubera]|uniref:MBOAT (Membrane bound O-acyl transferase) family protein n=1 Tax=Rhynchospora pubera TaxID=906938 RepID=A0AAV8H8R5_9POAL|nr:MBOAT (membrane bound O-acyl transferase) family protein [Rhynchospora pubera]